MRQPGSIWRALGLPAQVLVWYKRRFSQSSEEMGAAMARVCQVTGKKPANGNHVSHANNKTKRRFLPNLQSKRFWVEGEQRGQTPGFDLVFVAGVFHHIPPEERQGAADAVAAHMAPGGSLVVFEHNPYNPVTRKLAGWDALNPRAKIANFLLNFDASNAGVKIDDGKDNIFGDLGNDWLVGGTMNDRLFAGRGDDIINADDNLDTTGGNDIPDSPAFADADFAYGGDGLDVLIGNTGKDRLWDWSGEFNSFFVPFSQFAEKVQGKVQPPAPRPLTETR